MTGVPEQALKETCRVVAGRSFPQAVPLWPWHRARLEAGGCGAALMAEAEARAAAAVEAWGGPASSRLRLTVTADPDGTAAARCEQRLSSLDVPGGPVLAVVHVARAPELPSGPAKPVDRSAWDGPLSQARRLGAHQAVLAGPDDRVIDGATATLWLVMRGVLVTPPAPPAVPGVARAWLLEGAPGLGLTTRVDDVCPDDLGLAEELFLTNAFAGAIAARGHGGPVGAQVKAAFAGLWAAAPSPRGSCPAGPG